MPATIPIRPDLADDTAVIQIAEQLGLNEHHVVGLLVKVWGWVQEHADGGRVFGVKPAWLDRHVGVPTFANVLEQAGWLIVDDGLIFPRWGKYSEDDDSQDDPEDEPLDRKPVSASTRRVRRHRARLAAQSNPHALHETPPSVSKAFHVTPDVTPDVTLRNASEALHETLPLPDPEDPDPGSEFKSERPGSGTGRAVSVFRNVTTETLRRPELLQRWFRDAASRDRPVVRDNDRDYLFVFAASEHALTYRDKDGNAAKKPAALFASTIAKRREERITQVHEDAARERVKRCPREKPPPAPRADPPDLTQFAAAVSLPPPPRSSRDDQLDRLRNRYPARSEIP